MTHYIPSSQNSAGLLVFEECWPIEGRGKQKRGGLEAKGREWFRKQGVYFIPFKIAIIQKSGK